MALYAIGDVQGCARAFDALLAALRFDARRDRLWLVGDLVNRGPDSLGVLRTVRALGASALTVLGNHDLHLLATAAGVREPGPEDRMDAVLRSAERDELIDWLRHRPLLYHDAARNRVLVHAGIPPAWSLATAAAAAREVESLLRGGEWMHALEEMYGNTPTRWRKDLTRAERLRYTINALTRMRYCDADGELELHSTGPPGSQSAGLLPWFDHPLRAATDVHIVFGHWAALGVLRRADVTATDSGCVWGGALTAVPLDPPGEPIAVDCSGKSS
ncbi:MAG TPA: symmetrical bis(5'-nucleosyl)-tetraphosphatase [Gammaproteobacteria bacterium]|nr:symmetrical bis(5'-nucleosyl)-tetraphosphatase [Gammaproteobacteria bacterium]